MLALFQNLLHGGLVVIEIPEQLQDCMFVKLKAKVKAPHEHNWTKLYYPKDIIEKWTKAGNQYGVHGGTKVNDRYLVVIDADSEEVERIVEQKLDITFTVKTPKKGKHYYYFIDSPVSKTKITINKKHSGDIIGVGAQVVGPGSFHPDIEGTYEIIDPSQPIENLALDKLIEVFGLKVETKRGLEIDTGKEIGFELPERITFGTRDDTFTRLVASLVAQNYQDFEIQDIVLNIYEDRCDKDKEFHPLKKLKSWINSARQKFEVPQPPVEHGSVNKHRFVIAAIAVRDWKKLIFCASRYYQYEDGYYKQINEEIVNEYIYKYSNDKISPTSVYTILRAIRSKAYIDVELLNHGEELNVINGMLNLKTMTLKPFSEDYYSTIRLNVRFNKGEKCPIWIKSLNEILEEDQEKIGTLQEFMGLCFTRVTKFEKMLVMLGEGSNGKSTIIKILEKMLTPENVANVPIEKLDQPNYLAGLFGKLANISVETGAKSVFFDNYVKSIVSGDTIEAHAKYENQIRFRPFCKMILAANNLPRTDDKSHGFFRRLLILKFNKRFTEKDMNRDLRDILESEINGIFNWCMEGLDRLMRRGHFITLKSSEDSVTEYMKENNSALAFIDDCCEFNHEFSITKKALYWKYKSWCIDSGLKPMGIKVFGKELRRAKPGLIDEGRVEEGRSWGGIQIKEEYRVGVPMEERPF